MAKVEGPAFSISAHGTLADIITYQRRGNTTAAIKKPTPKDQQSSSQLSNRALMKTAREQWALLDQAQQTTWNNLALQQTGVSGYNLFIQNYFAENPVTTAVYYDAAAYNTFNYQ